MKSKVDLFNTAYSHFADELHYKIRRETYGADIGQTSWTTKAEYHQFIRLLNLRESSSVLDVACGSGGPSIFLVRTTGCTLTGVDINDSGIETAEKIAEAQGLSDKTGFKVVDANKKLPFSSNSFDSIICIDSFLHFPERFEVLKDWFRVLKPKGKILFTDPLVMTGLITNEEAANRTNIGFFVFSPPGLNEQLIEKAGFRLAKVIDGTASMARVASNWLKAREHYKSQLISLEGQDNFEGLQSFFSTVHKVAREKRLSRFIYVAQKK